MSYQALQPRTAQTPTDDTAVDSGAYGFAAEEGPAYGNAAAITDLGLPSSAGADPGAPFEALPVDPSGGGPVPAWAARCRRATSVYGYAQVQALLLAWSSWGVDPDRTDSGLMLAKAAFESGIDALRRGADAIPRDGGTNIDAEIDGYVGLLDELRDAALTAAGPPGEAEEALFSMVGDQLAAFDDAYLSGGGPAANPLLQSLLGIVGDTLAGDFVEDPHLAAIVIRTLVGLVPYVDQAMDLEDIIGNLYHLTWEGKYDSPAIWLALVLTLLGCIPELGSVLKGMGKGGVELVQQVAKRGAGAVPLDKLLELLGDAGKRLGVDGQLAALVEQWTKIAAEFDVDAIVASIAAKAVDLLTRVEQGAIKARGLLDGVSDAARKKFDDIAANARKARDAASKAVADGVDRARKGIDEVVAFVKEEVAVRKLKRAIGDAAFDDLVNRLGEPLVRELSVHLPGDVIETLSRKIDPATLARIGGDKVGRAVARFPPATLAAFEKLHGLQMAEFLGRDQRILDAFHALPPAEQVKVFDDIERLDKVFQAPGGARAAHIVTEHGPHVPDDYLFDRAKKMGKAVSRWDSVEKMEQAMAEAVQKMRDPTYLTSVRGQDTLDMFKKSFWQDVDDGKITVAQVLAAPWSYPQHFKGALSKFNPTYEGALAGAGKSFDPDGVTVTARDTFKIVLQWDTRGVLNVLTGYPI